MAAAPSPPEWVVSTVARTAPRPARRQLSLLVVAAALVALTAADKAFGLVQQPLYLATAAYGFILVALIWAGLSRLRRRRGLSIYAVCLFFLMATTGYVFAWKAVADPTPVWLLRELKRADSYIESGNLDVALLGLRELDRRAPHSYGVLSRLGAAYYRQGNFGAAVQNFRAAAAVAPKDLRWRALTDWGQSYWKSGESRRALELYRQAWDLGVPPTEQPLWHYRVASALFDLGEFDQAIPEYEQVVASRSEYAAAALYNIACALAQRQRDSTPLSTELAAQAVDYLRRAWARADNDDDRRALLDGILGGQSQRDPDLDPLRDTLPFRQFAETLRQVAESPPEQSPLLGENP